MKPTRIRLLLPLVAAAVVVGATRSEAQSSNTTATTSTTHHETDITVILPGSTVVTPGPGPLQNQLSQILAGPNGALVLNALNSIQVMGPVKLTPLADTLAGTNTSTSISLSFGPTTILIGNDQGQSFFVPAGTTNINTNVHTETFINKNFQSAQTLTASGVNWLIGDLHTTFQTTILDGEFNFVDGLLGRARDAGAQAPGADSAAMSYAEVSVGDDGMPTAALGYAGRSRGGPLYFKAPPPERGIWTAWAKGSFGRADFSGNAANFGFNYRTGGGTAGLDYRKGDWLAGFAAGFEQAKVTQDVTGDSGTIDTLRVGGYGSYRPGPWSLSGAVTGGFHSIDATRLALFPTPATSFYDATSINAGIEAARRFPLWGGTVQPLAGLVYTHLHTNAFTEGGTVFLDLAGNRADIDALKGYAGARAYRTYMLGSGSEVTPELRARILYDFLNDSRGYTATFIADPTATTFPVTGIQPNRTAALLGGGLTLRVAPQAKLFATYDAEIRGSDVAHLFSGGVKWKW